jgi:hypothetical protein
MTPNLRAWLVRYANQPLTISEYEYTQVKKQYAKGHDVLRHSFVSNHLHVSGSFATTAIEGENSSQSSDGTTSIERRKPTQSASGLSCPKRIRIRGVERKRIEMERREMEWKAPKRTEEKRKEKVLPPVSIR